MKAIVGVQGVQVCATEGAIFEVNRFKGSNGGEVIQLTDVFLLGEGESARVGTPTVEGASVTAKILTNKRNDKKLVIKRLRRKGFHKKRGHRQEISVIQIQSIQG
ncbi:MAG: 50S ribosomal protein L21 [Puniceicoccales bacterium]|jgi:large subunit ribosomal protein L21|nr:50S ribosomal protein L21 [Puniceicoccales bacterium]